jgi:quinol monooxygenase YgiN
VFLYERYGDRAAFEAHLASEHFLAFDAAVRGMIAAKSVRTLQRVDPR